jgi:hypothetical protein
VPASFVIAGAAEQSPAVGLRLRGIALARTWQPVICAIHPTLTGDKKNSSIKHCTIAGIAGKLRFVN